MPWWSVWHSYLAKFHPSHSGEQKFLAQTVKSTSHSDKIL